MFDVSTLFDTVRRWMPTRPATRSETVLPETVKVHCGSLEISEVEGGDRSPRTFSVKIDGVEQSNSITRLVLTLDSDDPMVTRLV